METLESIRQTIHTRRKLLGMRQAELARLSDVSLPTLKSLEQGRTRELGFNKVARILACLGLELQLQQRNQGRPTLDQLREQNEGDTEAKEVER